MGQRSTHIANTYELTIYAKCDSERLRYETITVDGGLGADFKIATNFEITNEQEKTSEDRTETGNSPDETEVESEQAEDKRHDKNEKETNRENSTKTVEKNSKKGRKIGYEKSAGLNAKLDTSISMSGNKIDPGFVRILPGKWVRFDVDCFGTRRVYITIKDEKGNLLCKNLAKRYGRSVYIDEVGQVRDTPRGESLNELCSPTCSK